MDNASKLLEIFLASTIHEAKNYLGHLNETIEQLIASNTEIPTERAALARGQVHNLSHLLTQVLIHYRGMHAGYQLHTEQVDLEDYFEDLEQRHQATLSAKHGKLKTKINTDQAAFFDEQLINNVLDTLIANALSAGATELTLIADSHLDDQLILELQDNGPGFPSHLLNQDFNSLQTEQAHENKTGLGLYLANQILQAHQNKTATGRMELLNLEAGGASVSLIIP